MFCLCDIIFYSELPDFLEISRVHLSHLSRASIVAAESPSELKPWMQRFAKYDFPLPVGSVGKARFWDRAELLDWQLTHNSPE
jgi:hypothetical protein